jgi:predicted permease
LPGFGTLLYSKIHWDNRLLFPIAWIAFVFLSYFLFLEKIQLVQEAHWLFDLNCRTRKHLFLGFPIIQALYGAEGMKTAILVDQPGLLLCFDTWYSGMTLLRENRMANFKKNSCFPPFITFYSSLLNVFGFDFQDWIQFILQKVGSKTPLACRFQLL